MDTNVNTRQIDSYNKVITKVVQLTKVLNKKNKITITTFNNCAFIPIITLSSSFQSTIVVWKGKMSLMNNLEQICE